MRQGVVNERFLHECQELCASAGIAAGTIRGIRTGGKHISLRFSREIEPEHHQRFRNVYHAT